MWSLTSNKRFRICVADNKNEGKVCNTTDTLSNIIRSRDKCSESDSNMNTDLDLVFKGLSFGKKNILLAVNALCAAGVERKEKVNKKIMKEQNDFELDNISQLLIDKTIYSACRECLLHLGEIVFNHDKNDITTIGNDIENGKNPEEIVTLLKEMKICEKNVIKADSSGFSLLSVLLPIEITKDMDIQKLMLYRKVQSNAVKEIFRKYL